jgi:hypothetical protein
VQKQENRFENGVREVNGSRLGEYSKTVVKHVSSILRLVRNL